MLYIHELLKNIVKYQREHTDKVFTSKNDK